jgi:hypothetical protein
VTGDNLTEDCDLLGYGIVVLHVVVSVLNKLTDSFFRLRVEAVCLFKIFVIAYQTIQWHNPGDNNLNFRRHESMSSQGD